ncbi:MAG: hypothetical protein HY431_02355, partial [Candidatus Levybacteria bacterium]|nr:hypothetical protein [Candidatus Levybacteria bacterium]
MENKRKLALRIENLSVFIVGIFLLIVPILVLGLTTDAFGIPKQAAAALVSLAGLVLLGAKGVLNGSVKLRRTPYDLPIVLFGVAAFLSALFALNRFDAFISFVSLLFIIVLFFVITNSAKRGQDVLFLTASLIIGA